MGVGGEGVGGRRGEVEREWGVGGEVEGVGGRRGGRWRGSGG